MSRRRWRAIVALGMAQVVWLLTTETAAAGQALPVESAGAATTVGLWLSRLLDLTALAVTVGLLLVPTWLVDPEGGQAAILAPVGRHAARTAGLAAVVWAAAAIGLYVFALSNAAARSVGEVMQPAMLTRFADTRFGSAVVAQAVAALLVAGLATAARTRAGAAVALAGAALGALAPGWWGHGATSSAPAVAVTSHAIHVLAAVVWVGGLVALIGLFLPAADDGADVLAGVDGGRAWQRFSRLAGWALAAVGVTGVVNALLRIGVPANLVDTVWGRLVLLKALLFVGIGALGAHHRRRSLPALVAPGAGPGSRTVFRRLALVEAFLMAAAFATATTMASGIPADVEAASRVQLVTGSFADGQLNLSLDPAETGDNVVHLYFFDAGGLLRPVDDAAVTLRREGAEVRVPLVPAGPGHYTAPRLTLTDPGLYRVEVSGTVEAGQARASGTVTIR